MLCVTKATSHDEEPRRVFWFHPSWAAMLLLLSFLAACERSSATRGSPDTTAPPPQVEARDTHAPDTASPEAEPPDIAWAPRLSQAAVQAAAGWARWLPVAELDPFGIDQDGWLHAPETQELPPLYVLDLLEDLDRAEAVLRRGQITEIHSLDPEHLVFKATLKLAPEDASHIGQASIPIAVKTRAASEYGGEYRRELAFYKLARHLRAEAGLVPIIERPLMPWKPTAGILETQLSTKQLKRISTRLVLHEDELWLYGSAQLWVKGYQPILGHNPSSGARFEVWTRALHPQRRKNFGDPAWQTLSDMFVLDYLSYNFDRARELGSVRLLDGGQRLILLDNGDAFHSKNPKKTAHNTQQYFNAMGLFSPNVYQGLKDLNEVTISTLFQDAFGHPLIPVVHQRRLLRRARVVVKRIESRGERSLFPRPSPSMVHSPRLLTKRVQGP